jgi:hypothetical protein
MPTKTINENEKENKNLESQSKMREKKEKGNQDDQRLQNITEKKKMKENHHLYRPVLNANSGFQIHFEYN